MLFFWSVSLYLFLEWLKQPDFFAFASDSGLAVVSGSHQSTSWCWSRCFCSSQCLAIAEWRKPMAKGWFWIIAGVLIGFAPVLIWNAQNNLISFRFQAEHGLGEEAVAYRPVWTTDYLLAQLGLIFPTLLYWAIRGTKRSPVWIWLLAWGPLLFFLYTSTKSNVEANWPIVAYTEVFVLAVLWLKQPTRAFRWTIGIWAFAMFAMLALIITRWSPTGEPIRSREFFQFEPLVSFANDHDPVYARTYQMASTLSFLTKKPIYKLRGMNRIDFFDFLDESEPTAETFYLLTEKQDLLPPENRGRGLLDCGQDAGVWLEFFTLIWKVTKQ